MYKILISFTNLLSSPRFIAFYWHTGAMVLVEFLNLIAQNISHVGLPNWAVIGIGLIIPQITKALNNYLNNKPMGFATK